MNRTNPNATRYTAIGLVVFGLIMLYLSWNAAASVDNGIDIRAQFPYLLSGGLGGLALVGTGLTLIRVFESRRDTKQVTDQLKRLTAAVEQLQAGQQPGQQAAHAPNGAGPAVDAGAFPPPSPPFEHAQ